MNTQFGMSPRFGYSFTTMLRHEKSPKPHKNAEQFMRDTAAGVAKMAPYYAKLDKDWRRASQHRQELERAIDPEKTEKVEKAQYPKKTDPLFFIIGNADYVTGVFLDRMNDFMKPVFKAAGISIEDTSFMSKYSIHDSVRVSEISYHNSPEAILKARASYEKSFESMADHVREDMKPGESKPEKGFMVTYGGDFIEIDYRNAQS
jgi:hypothetical protein